MKKGPPLEFMKTHGIDADEVWEVRPGTYAVKHSALERVAAEKNIAFDTPLMLEFHAADKIAVLCVTGRIGDRSEWSIGEAAPYNNKNGYPFAMAEKRAKDRVILKLLNAHGVYSDTEADDFAEKPKRKNPHVTEPTDIVPDIECDQYGDPVDNIPHGDPSIDRLPKAKSRDDFGAWQAELNKISSLSELRRFGADSANRIATYPSDFQAIARGLYKEHKQSLEQKEAA